MPRQYEVGACEVLPPSPPRYVLRPYIQELGYRALDSAKARRQHTRAARQGRVKSRNLTPRVKSGQRPGMLPKEQRHGT